MKPLDYYLSERRAATQPHLGDRSTRIGSSEIGRCARHVVWSKLNPGKEVLDSKSLGKFLRGRVLENEVIQLIRLRGKDEGVTVQLTGANQVELTNATMIGHPDGLWGNDTIIEVKTADPNVFRAWVKDGFTPTEQHMCQIQQNCGLARTNGMLVTHATIFLTNADNMETVEQTVPFDQKKWEELVRRSELMVEAIRGEVLPPGEPERAGSFCSRCPIRGECKDRGKRKDAPTGIGLEESLALDEKLDALAKLAPFLAEAEAITAEEARLKAEVKALLPDGASYTSECGAKATLSVSTRTTVDAKRLKAEQPDAYEKFSTTTTVTALKVTLPKE